jgi:HEAT repeat protein
MGYKRVQQTVEGDPEVVIHQAGETQQRELVEQLAASGSAGLPVLFRAYEEAQTTRLRCYILDALPGGDERQALPIIEAGLSDRSASVRGHALDALTRCREADRCGLLLPRLTDSNATIRCRAFAAAIEAQCRSEEVIAGLLKGARDPDWRIRQAAARSLGGLDLREAADALGSLVADPRNAVRVAAKEALERLNHA